MDTSVKVFGHKSPDTDTTCSAIIWAWFLNQKGKSAEAYMLGAPNKETAYVLGRWGVTQPKLLEKLDEKDPVVIVDTNNPQELFDNIAECNIIGIVDHHKLSGLSTKAPLDIIMRTYACTATVMYEAMGEIAEHMPKEIAGLAISCILSDTLEFRSPTTTALDKEVAETLAKKHDIDMHALAEAMFAAKSDVSEYSDEALIGLDSKKFEVGGKNLLISSIETTTPGAILARKDGLSAAMQAKAGKEADEVLLFVIDILKEEATVITYNDVTRSIIEKSFGKKTENNIVVLPGVVSRKKQIIPALKI